MPSKFGKQYKVPPEFPSLLKAFTREVLRAQPGDIYEFGAQYFTEMVAQEEAAAQAENAGNRRLSPAELRELLSGMFAEADVDSSGALSLQEFRSLLQNADLGLSDKDMRRVMADADVNNDGEVSYEEFLPLAVDLVTTMYARMDSTAQHEKDEDEARLEAQNYLLHGMTQEQVEATMQDVFRSADADGSGALSVTEFRQACKDADIGLTKKEINLLMHQCDADGDGNISYDEFVPLCFELLTEILKEQLLEEKRGPDELVDYLNGLWAELDFADEGRLDAPTLKKGLVNGDLGLTRVQMHSVLAEAEFDEDDLCKYRKQFAPRAAEIIYRITDPEMQIERMQSLEAMAATGSDFSTVRGMDAQQISDLLSQEFRAEAAGADTLPLSTVKQVLSRSQLSLTPQEVNALLAASDVDANNAIQFDTLASYAFYILQYLAENAALA